MATTEDTVALQKGAIAPAQKEQTGSQKAVSLIDSLITKPSLPTGTTISPQLQNVGPQELLSYSRCIWYIRIYSTYYYCCTNYSCTRNYDRNTSSCTNSCKCCTDDSCNSGWTNSYNDCCTRNCISSYDCSSGTITSDATVKGQLAGLQQEVETALASGNPLPVWARGAAKATEAAMANRGLSASSMAAEALAEGIMNSAIPIAAQMLLHISR